MLNHDLLEHLFGIPLHVSLLFTGLKLTQSGRHKVLIELKFSEVTTSSSGLHKVKKDNMIDFLAPEKKISHFSSWVRCLATVSAGSQCRFILSATAGWGMVFVVTHWGEGGVLMHGPLSLYVFIESCGIFLGSCHTVPCGI